MKCKDFARNQFRWPSLFHSHFSTRWKKPLIDRMPLHQQFCFDQTPLWLILSQQVTWGYSTSTRLNSTCEAFSLSSDPKQMLLTSFSHPLGVYPSFTYTYVFFPSHSIYWKFDLMVPGEPLSLRTIEKLLLTTLKELMRPIPYFDFSSSLAIACRWIKESFFRALPSIFLWNWKPFLLPSPLLSLTLSTSFAEYQIKRWISGSQG